MKLNEEEEKEICRLINIGMPYELIIKKMEKCGTHVSYKNVRDLNIFLLREQGYTYKKICKCLNEKNEKITSYAIKARCKIIYKEMGKQQPKKIKNISDEQIYELRNKGMKYVEITEYFNNQGYTISKSNISQRCKRIYKEKGEQEPITGNKINIPEDELLKLYNEGMKVPEMLRYFKDKGIKISYMALRSKYLILFGESKKNEISEQIYNLRQKRMSYDKICEYLKANGIKTNKEKIRLICQIMYREKGEKEPVAKRNDVPVDTIVKQEYMSAKSLEELNKELDEKIEIKIRLDNDKRNLESQNNGEKKHGIINDGR